MPRSPTLRDDLRPITLTALGGILAFAGLPVETIGDRFGDLPRSLTAPALPGSAPLAVHIPLAGLAGVLIVVAWNMFEKEEVFSLIRVSRADAAVLLTTFLLVVFRDLTEGIDAGTALGGAVFIRRMSEAAKLEQVPAPNAAPREQAENVVDYSLRGRISLARPPRWAMCWTAYPRCRACWCWTCRACRLSIYPARNPWSGWRWSGPRQRWPRCCAVSSATMPVRNSSTLWTKPCRKAAPTVRADPA